MKSIKLVIKPYKNLILPFAHFDIFQGVAYKLMSYDSELSKKIHDRQFDGIKPFKYFCFTDLAGKYAVSGKKLIYKDSFIWELRSADDRIIDAVMESVKHNSIMEIYKQRVEIISAEISKKVFLSDTIDIKMNTPIVIYKTNKTGYVNYRNPFEKEFYEGVINNIRNKYSSFFGKGIDSNIEVICPEQSERDKCVTKYKDMIITAWYGRYRINAKPEILDFIYHTGLGGKNSMGFGTIAETVL